MRRPKRSATKGSWGMPRLPAAGPAHRRKPKPSSIEAEHLDDDRTEHGEEERGPEHQDSEVGPRSA